MRYAAFLVAAAAPLLPTAALGQAAPVSASGFTGAPTYSTYPSNPCAQCAPQASALSWAVAAEPRDLRVGYRVLSNDGDVIGSVAAADATSAVVRTPTTLVRVPARAFGKSRYGLVLEVTPARLEKLALAARR